MYCSSCGALAKKGLSYCNRCGTELIPKERDSKESSEVSQESLVWAVVAISVGGLAMMIGLLAVMKEAGLQVELITAFTLLGFLIIMGVGGALLWMLLRSKRSARITSDLNQSKGLDTSELESAQPPALPESVLSVTEHTTRTLDHVERDYKAE